MISVIMPLYNNEKYVIEAIQSVINQTYKDWELIIINDASTDNSKEIVQRFLHKQLDSRIKFIDLENNKGVSFTRNLGIKEAKGEYISFLDSDDLWDKEFLKLSYLKLKENYKFVYTNFYYLYENNKLKKSYSCNKNGYLNDFISNAKNRYEFIFPFCVGCVVIEKNLLEIYKINFPEKQFLFEDVLFFAELLCITKSGFVENTMAYYRTYRIIWRIIKSGDVDRGIELIKKYRKRLKKFGNIKDFKWNDRLKCKIFLLNNKFLLNLLKNI